MSDRYEDYDEPSHLNQGYAEERPPFDSRYAPASEESLEVVLKKDSTPPLDDEDEYDYESDLSNTQNSNGRDFVKDMLKGARDYDDEKDGQRSTRRCSTKKFFIFFILVLVILTVICISVFQPWKRRGGGVQASTLSNDTAVPLGETSGETSGVTPGETSVDKVDVSIPASLAPTPVLSMRPTGIDIAIGSELALQLSNYSSPDKLADLNSPQRQAIQRIVTEDANSTYPNEVLVQKFSLLTLFYSTGGNDMWTTQNAWSGGDICEWEGIVCYSRRRKLDESAVVSDVKAIILVDNNMKGSIPNEVCNLKFLKRLSFGFNQLEGEIPGCLSDLNELKILELNNNIYEGSIPSSLYETSGITVLKLNGNKFGGSLDSNVTKMEILEVFDVSNNQLDGSIPVELGFLRSLRRLSVGSNGLSGTLNSELITGLGSLELLDVSNNKLSGTIPTDIGFLTSLIVLNVNDNLFTGALPFQLGRLFNLVDLQLHGNNMTGEVPGRICQYKFFNEDMIVTSDCDGLEPAVYCDCCSECY